MALLRNGGELSGPPTTAPHTHNNKTTQPPTTITTTIRRTAEHNHSKTIDISITEIRRRPTKQNTPVDRPPDANANTQHTYAFVLGINLFIRIHDSGTWTTTQRALPHARFCMTESTCGSAQQGGRAQVRVQVDQLQSRCIFRSPLYGYHCRFDRRTHNTLGTYRTKTLRTHDRTCKRATQGWGPHGTHTPYRTRRYCQIALRLVPQIASRYDKQVCLLVVQTT